jgi:hypothetical protein
MSMETGENVLLSGILCARKTVKNHAVTASYPTQSLDPRQAANAFSQQDTRVALRKKISDQQIRQLVFRRVARDRPQVR